MGDDHFLGTRGLCQLFYLGFALFVFSAAVLCVPYTNPLTQEVHWSWPWSPPRYELANMKEILSPQAMADLAQLPVPAAEDFYKNSTTAEMRPHMSLRRKILLFSFLLLMAGWFAVPSWINQMAVRVLTILARPVR